MQNNRTLSIGRLFLQDLAIVAPKAGAKFVPGEETEVRNIRRSEAANIARALGMEQFRVVEYPSK